MSQFTVRPIFLASVASAMFANGLSAPQHSTYLVILLLGLDLFFTNIFFFIYKRHLHLMEKLTRIARIVLRNKLLEYLDGTETRCFLVPFSSGEVGGSSSDLKRKRGAHY